MSKPRFIYLAFPIDQAMGAELKWQVDWAQEELGAAGFGVYNPGGAFSAPAGMELGDEIHKINWRALTLCEGMLALLPEESASLGVPMEIERAVRQIGIPVAVVTNVESWALAGLLHNGWIRQFVEAEAAVAWLREQDIGDGGRRDRLAFTVGEGGKLPTRTYPDDAGLDLYCSEETVVRPGQWADVPTSVAVELPSWAFGLIKARSSTLRISGLLVQDGVIDPGWRGELFVQVYNPRPPDMLDFVGEGNRTIKAGDRIGQLIVVGNAGATMEPVEVERLTEHPRGQNGFGSSGR